LIFLLIIDCFILVLQKSFSSGNQDMESSFKFLTKSHLMLSQQFENNVSFDKISEFLLVFDIPGPIHCHSGWFLKCLLWEKRTPLCYSWKPEMLSCSWRICPVSVHIPLKRRRQEDQSSSPNTLSLERERERLPC